jgi:hypothetical protein
LVWRELLKEKINMYWNEPEQRLEPKELTSAQEYALEEADTILGKIYKLHEKVETFFEELNVGQVENILSKASSLLEELYSLASNHGDLLEDELRIGDGMFQEIEGWYHEKEDTIKTEGDL